MLDLKDEFLISGLINQDIILKPEEILQALLNGCKVKLNKAPKGVNFYLKNGEIVSDKITYLKGIPITWFNPDIKYVIDYD